MESKRPYNKLSVKLKAGDAERIDRYLRTHVLSRRIWTRLLILKLLDKGFPASQVAEIAGVSPTTVRAIARRYMQAGLDDILNPIR